MMWSKDHKVIWDKEQAQNYNTDKQTLILSDGSESPPGYTLLVLMTLTNMDSVYLAGISINDRFYISSSELRKVTLSGLFPGFTEHGPCSSGFMYDMDFDTAHCFACDIWPPLASPWIARSQAWPGSQRVNEIVKSGCHLVPIGHKQGNHEDDEWRISFSLAEQKLVYSMNHSQFLTYGMLKLFLKEVVNHGVCAEDKILCSYHMKTAVFWVLQQNTVRDWCPQNLLEGFWDFFRFILKCVYEGVCPNFFIPKNNIFLGKIQGKAQNDLFITLYALYERGYSSLPYSSTISNMIHQPNNPGQLLCTHEEITFQEMGISASLDREKEIDASALEKRIWINKRKMVVAGKINLEKGICYIKELYLEQQYSLNSHEDVNITFIPAILLLHMLEFLCYSQIDPVHVKAESALQELQSLVFEDQLESPSVMEGDISWQILGICQQMSGKY
ncbi:uncharacterized protein LOC134252598, partial [Saccostrea cucullata]|uniref:uncharacterized protein LOC134252598 n=1 Tax=Saccostrea cuccullata TaxID=36930 RepID=UPI002ED45842